MGDAQTSRPGSRAGLLSGNQRPQLAPQSTRARSPSSTAAQGPPTREGAERWMASDFQGGLGAAAT